MAQNQADGEKLHDLTRIVFIRLHKGSATRIIFRPVAHVTEVDPHHRTVSHLLQKVAVLPKGTR